MQYTAVGMDIGHSAVKLAWNDLSAPRSLIFPSAVVPHFHISEENTRRQSESDTVVVEGQKFFVGDTAAVQSATSVTGLNMDWIKTREHSALLVGANYKLDQNRVPTEGRVICLGLPVVSMARQQAQLQAEASRLLPGAIIKIFPQPLAAYQTLMLDMHGSPMPNRSMLNESWAVIDVGHFTSDIILMDKGRWIEDASGSCSGISKACSVFQRLIAAERFEVDLLEAEECLKTGRLMEFGKVIDVRKEVEASMEALIAEIREEAQKRLADRVRKLNGVLITGGGADVVHEALIKIWPNTQKSANPRMAVADGMRRLATAMIKMGRIS